MASVQLRNRRRTIESARAAGQAPDPLITASWSRSRTSVDAGSPAAPVDAEPDEVQRRWEASPIRRSGIGVEEQLGRAAEASGLIAAITDEDGRILWSAGSRRMRTIAEGVGFVPGGRWDEPSAGTNALGLALLTGRTATVFSAEHWRESVQDWVCWSAPVCTADGRALGVLDLSGPWDASTPMAELAVTTLARLVQSNLPVDAGADTPDTLVVRLLGQPEFLLGGRRLSVTPRQGELLAALAIEGPASLDRLHELVYGDRPVSSVTVKAELSHLRQVLGGGIASRPYRLTMPVRVDALEVRQLLQRGDVPAAVDAYGGQLLPDSESPFALEHRHVIDVTLRRSLLEGGSPAELLRFADVHRFDAAVLERVLSLCGRGDPLRHEAEARLEIARGG